LECLRSLDRQTQTDFEVVIVDNSGEKRVRQMVAARSAAVIVEPERNVGFGAAVNLGLQRARAPFLATLNDDAVAHPGWLAALLETIEERTDVGMCASAVRLFGENRLDSAGMLIAGDGSSKQRGHLEAIDRFSEIEEALLPSGSAALYRRAMLDEIGLFDESFFLYCEDTDLGLRARWAGWKCLFVPQAVVEHRYSHSAGRASPLKAYYVERNRLFVVVKNYPVSLLVRAPFYSAARYLWHVVLMLRGRGAAAEFHREGHGPARLLWFVIRAHLALLGAWPRLWRQRRELRRRARISPREFAALVRLHSLSPRQVAAL
jgi:GT2 family glycosyltransferase